MRLPLVILFLVSVLAVQAEARPVSFATAAPNEGSVVLPLAGAADLDRRGGAFDDAVRGAITRALDSAKFPFTADSSLSLRGIGVYDQIVILGLGDKALEPVDLQDVGGRAARATAADAGPVALIATGLAPDQRQAALDLALGAALAGGDRLTYKSGTNPDPAGAAPLVVVTPDSEGLEGAYQRQLQPLAEAVLFARGLVNEPANILYPESFVARSRDAFKGVRNVSIEVLDVGDMEKLNMGAILSVGQGSVRPPRLMAIRYQAPGSAGDPVVLVGKGITFDTGGISIKPGKGMSRMKSDMSGAAAVVGTVLSLARQEAPVHVVAIAALAENMPDGRATRPGDVVRTTSGQTIEIINTDAEGRLVLADAVAYAESRFKPAAVVDVATLTGAMVVALGHDYAGLFSRHQALADQLAAAGRATGELLWPLPLHPSYAEVTRSAIADIRNSAESGAAGAGQGAHFIGFFLNGTTPWAHLDIAGMAWATDQKPTTPRDGTGFGVRLLNRFVQDFQAVPPEPTGGF